MKVGDKVTYIPFPGCSKEIYEHGRVKGFASDGDLFVVYRCADQWHRYVEFTGAKTRQEDLIEGWAPK